jgi:rhodanese-related sulfurtransferase
VRWLRLGGEPEVGHVLVSRIEPRTVTARIAHGELVTLVDCRAEASVCASGSRAARALSLPPASLLRAAADLPRTGLLVLYAEDEVRAALAARRLVELGFSNELAVLAGGLGAWAQARLPVEAAEVARAA